MLAMNFDLEVQTRSNLGKGASRRLRHAKKVLGIVYGGIRQAAIPIILEEKIVLKYLENKYFFSKLLNLKIDDNKYQKVVLRDLQRHPFKPIVLHMDFLRVKSTDKIHMTIPLHFIGVKECLGIKQGGIINYLINEVNIRCLAGNIPEYFEVDVSKLKIDNSILLSNLQIPKDIDLIMLTHNNNQVIAQVNMPRIDNNVVEEPNKESSNNNAIK